MDTKEIIKIQRLLGLPQDGIIGKKTSRFTKLIKTIIRKESINKIFKQNNHTII